MNTLVSFMHEVWYSLTSITSSIQIKDVIDILAVAVVIYYILRFISERRAGKLAIGIVLIFAMQIISEVFSLVTFRFIMQNVFQVGIIALVILFQPELRSALEKVGGSSLKSLKSITETHSTGETEKMINAVCEAAAEFSKEKTGALIVFERSTRLGDIIASGVVVNADVTTFLLRNIFFNKAPLHDGAVIIRDRRVYAAGCFLPLSTNMDIVKDLGTRHRAAIGMSENSDSLALVVSEETGTISLAVEGKLYRNLDYTQLKNMLGEMLNSYSSPGDKMRKAFKTKKPKEEENKKRFAETKK